MGLPLSVVCLALFAGTILISSDHLPSTVLDTLKKLRFFRHELQCDPAQAYWHTAFPPHASITDIVQGDVSKSSGWHDLVEDASGHCRKGWTRWPLEVPFNPGDSIWYLCDRWERQWWQLWNWIPKICNAGKPPTLPACRCCPSRCNTEC